MKTYRFTIMLNRDYPFSDSEVDRLIEGVRATIGPGFVNGRTHLQCTQQSSTLEKAIKESVAELLLALPTIRIGWVEIWLPDFSR